MNNNFHSSKINNFNNSIKCNLSNNSHCNIAIISTHWHSEKLESFINHIKLYLGVSDISEFKVPGSFEIPYVVSKIMDKYKVIICIGAVIKGDTAHFEYISNSVSSGLMNLQIQGKTPIINGVLNCYNEKQFYDRIDVMSGLAESLANSALYMANEYNNK